MAVAKSKTSHANSAPKRVANFAVLPLLLPPASPGLPEPYQNAAHYLYIRLQSSRLFAPRSDRSLFLANVPMDASEASLRTLFSDQLGGARVERVEFDDSVPAPPLHKRWRSSSDGPRVSDTMEHNNNNNKRGEERERTKKRKRTREEEEEGKKEEDKALLMVEGIVEDQESALPRLWKTRLRRSGSGAVVVFVDERNATAAFHYVQKAVQENQKVYWKGSSKNLGPERYQSHNALTYPPFSVLQSSVNAYLAQFASLETSRSRSRRAACSAPDEDGFITVMAGGGSRTGAARLETAERKKTELELRRKKNAVRDDFYRFQNREKRKERERELRRGLERDRERVREMRERREK